MNIDISLLTPETTELLLNFPAGEPPPGVQFNVDNPHSRSIDGNIDGGICFAVASLAVFMRFYTKLFLMRQFTLEDYVLLLAYALFVVMMGFIFRYVDHGLYHTWDIRVRDVSWYLYNVRIIAIVYGLALAAAKAAILVQYLRIFVPFKQKGSYMYWSCHILIWCNILLYLVSIFALSFQCRPARLAYDPLTLIREDRYDVCINVFAYFTGSAAINTVLDFIILFLPQKVIWNLKISRKRKIGISAVFAVGFLACIASIMRLYYSARTLNSTDILNDITNMGLWVIPEVACGLLISSLPVAPRFFQSLLDSRLGSSLRTLVGSASSPESKGKDSYHQQPYNRNSYVRESTVVENRISILPQSPLEKPRGQPVNEPGAGNPETTESPPSEDDESMDYNLDLSTLEGGPSIMTIRAQHSDSRIRDKAPRGVWLDDSRDENDDEAPNTDIVSAGNGRTSSGTI